MYMERMPNIELSETQKDDFLNQVIWNYGIESTIYEYGDYHGKECILKLYRTFNHLSHTYQKRYQSMLENKYQKITQLYHTMINIWAI